MIRQAQILILVLFCLAVAAEALFTLARPRTRNFDENVEPEIAGIIEANYARGDAVFVVPGWDIGFTRYLTDTPKELHLGLDEIDRVLYRGGKAPDPKMIFILEKSILWDGIARDYNLIADQIISIGKHAIVIVKAGKNNGA